MAFKLRRSYREPMSEINVTPFVDVMLVLLIIFMVTAPLLTVGIPVDLPKFKANALTDQNTKTRIYLRGDRVVAYGRIMEIMSIINSAGYEKVALVTQNPKK